MSKFYSIKEPKHNNIKHGQVVLCIDNWGNLFEAKYDARYDRFIQLIKNANVYSKFHWDYDSNLGDYTTDRYHYNYTWCNAVITDISPYANNRIVKFMPWNKEDSEGIKS